IYDFELKKLYDDIFLLKNSMLPKNYVNTDVIGEIKTNNYSTKLKKVLIIFIAFLTGLILSIFLVFFIEFIKNLRNLKKEKINE
ncbi:hypothetical protein CRU99_13170, partial [Malaciobacter mytili]